MWILCLKMFQLNIFYNDYSFVLFVLLGKFWISDEPIPSELVVSSFSDSGSLLSPLISMNLYLKLLKHFFTPKTHVRIVATVHGSENCAAKQSQLMQLFMMSILIQTINLSRLKVTILTCTFRTIPIKSGAFDINRKKKEIYKFINYRQNPISQTQQIENEIIINYFWNTDKYQYTVLLGHDDFTKICIQKG
ncbi:hypothetical protein BpHYR1_051749 [Brachionus plicatilis]|uniref:Uncharacterized protein n=1 Tax=Brachionus plicatilis TaxID=10195 RepID=A0A3M7QA59_BRAPC|nr:hypothetical protein BpHYR1_051749 [Brachionus plicatilis]